jgi:puromycin-sensitive aminopeptidase
MCLCNKIAAGLTGASGAAPAAASSAPAAHDDVTTARLPSHVTPQRYDLTLLPNLLEWTFDGYLCAHVTVLEPTRFIQMHAAELAFQSVAVTAGHVPSLANPAAAAARAALAPAPAAVAVSEHAFDADSERVLITLASELAPGPYTIELAYTGSINDNLCGLYRSTLVDADGTTHRVACTQFEATDARRCLPCWDEPAYKAVYQCTVIADSHYTVLNNMPVREQSTVMVAAPALFGLATGAVAAKGSVVRHFGETPLMSSYLLAFVIGEFDYVQKTTKAGVDLKVYTPQGKAAQGLFSLDLAGKALDFFATFFNEPFPLPKLDLIAIPDFAAGAMENWGLITYRDTALLVDPATTTSATLRQTARTVCHEIAHMWFGNLVTMEWWTHLWLNEGFARYCEFMAVDHAFPDWNVWQWFVADPYNQALTLDANKSSHAIEVEVNRPEEINEIFDAISYAKGASVIRMLATYMGPAFAEGVRGYLAKFRYRNALSTDLWACLDEAWVRARAAAPAAAAGATTFVHWAADAGAGAVSAAGAAAPSISDIMRGWTGQVNYPIVAVTKTSTSADGRTATFKLSQSSVVAVSTGADDARLWSVLLTVAAPLSAHPAARHSLLFNTRECEWSYTATSADAAAEIAALKFNADCSGVCRVHYLGGVTAELRALVAGAGPAGATLSPQDKLGLLRDTLALFQAGQLPIGDVLDMFKLFAREDNLPVLAALSANVCEVLARHHAHPCIGHARRELREAFAGQYARFGWGDVDLATGRPSDSVERSKRVAVITMMLAARDPLATTEGLALYERVVAANAAALAGTGKTDLSLLAPDLQGTVLALGARHAGRAVDFTAPLANDFEAPVPAEAAATAGERAFETFVALHKGAAGSTSAQLKAVAGICAIGDASVRAARALPFVLDGSTVRMQDKPSALMWLSASRGGDDIIWGHLKTNWEAVYTRFKTSYAVGVRAVVNAACAGRTTLAERDDIAAFFAAHPCPEAKTGIERILEVIADNAAKLPKEEADLARYYA